MRRSYLFLPPGGTVPTTELSHPHRVMLVSEASTEAGWRALVARALVESGCLYFVAWGIHCAEWEQAVDEANIEDFGYGHISEERFVMTTCHANEPLQEAIWFCENSAFHATVNLSDTLIVHVAQSERQADLLEAYENASRSI